MTLLTGGKVVMVVIVGLLIGCATVEPFNLPPVFFSPIAENVRMPSPLPTPAKDREPCATRICWGRWCAIITSGTPVLGVCDDEI